MAYGITERTPLSKAQRRLTALETERGYWDDSWKQLRQYLASQRGFFTGDMPNRGERNDDTLVDMTPARALRTLAAGMHSGVTNPARPWLKLLPHDPEMSEYQPVKTWLDDVGKIILRIFGKSNLYSILPGLYAEFGGFGTGCMLVEPDFKNVIRCRPFTVGSYCLDNDESMRTDTFARTYYSTVLQLVGRFGIENCPRVVREAYRDGKDEEWYQVHHLIEKRKEKSAGLNKLPYASRYWVDSATTDDPNGGFLEDGGYEEFPVMAPRWETIASDCYGKESPGWVGLGDSMMLQTQQDDRLELVDKISNPALFLPPSFEQAGVSLLPGAVNFGVMGQGERVESLTVNPNLNDLMIGIQDTRAQIKEAFFVDLFMMFNSMSGPEKTAREIAERSSEKLLMLGPMLQRTHNELLDPLIMRTFNIAWRAGILPPPPPEMENGEIRVEYTSVLAQAQRMTGTTGMEQFSGFVGNIAQIDPTVLDKIDRDQLIDEYGNALGVPSRIIVPDEQVAQIRQARAKQEEQAKQMEQMTQLAGTAKDLGNVQTGSNSALDALLKGGA